MTDQPKVPTPEMIAEALDMIKLELERPEFIAGESRIEIEAWNSIANKKARSQNWGGPRPNSGRRKINMPLREGQKWQLTEPLRFGDTMFEGEKTKTIINLTVQSVTRDEIVFVSDDELMTFTLTRKDVPNEP